MLQHSQVLSTVSMILLFLCCTVIAVPYLTGTAPHVQGTARSQAQKQICNLAVTLWIASKQADPKAVLDAATADPVRAAMLQEALHRDDLWKKLDMVVLHYFPWI